MQTIKLTDDEVMRVLQCITYQELDMKEAKEYCREPIQKDYYARKEAEYAQLWDLIFNGGHE